MRATETFFARHSLAIQLTGCVVIIIACVLDAYLDFPAPFSVPLSAYVVLVGAPLLIVVSLRAPMLDESRPKSLRNFIRLLPWLLGGWWCFTVFLFVATLVSNAHVRNILYHG
jgi:hypothetical protein